MTLDDRIKNLNEEYREYLSSSGQFRPQCGDERFFRHWVFKKLAEHEKMFAVMGELSDSVQELKRNSEIVFDI